MRNQAIKDEDITDAVKHAHSGLLYSNRMIIMAAFEYIKDTYGPFHILVNNEDYKLISVKYGINALIFNVYIDAKIEDFVKFDALKLFINTGKTLESIAKVLNVDPLPLQIFDTQHKIAEYFINATKQEKLEEIDAGEFL